MSINSSLFSEVYESLGYAIQRKIFGIYGIQTDEIWLFGCGSYRCLLDLNWARGVNGSSGCQAMLRIMYHTIRRPRCVR